MRIQSLFLVKETGARTPIHAYRDFSATFHTGLSEVINRVINRHFVAL